MRLSPTMIGCMAFLRSAGHPVTYDRIPFSDRTIDALAIRGLVKKTLMQAELTDDGYNWLAIKDLDISDWSCMVWTHPPRRAVYE